MTKVNIVYPLPVLIQSYWTPKNLLSFNLQAPSSFSFFSLHSEIKIPNTIRLK